MQGFISNQDFILLLVYIAYCLCICWQFLSMTPPRDESCQKGVDNLSASQMSPRPLGGRPGAPRRQRRWPSWCGRHSPPRLAGLFFSKLAFLLFACGLDRLLGGGARIVGASAATAVGPGTGWGHIETQDKAPTQYTKVATKAH